MASVAKLTYIAFGSNGSVSTKVDRSTNFDTIQMPREMEEVETTTFGNNGNRTYLPGLKGATFTASGNWDTTIDGHLHGIVDGQDVVDFSYCPVANSTGNVIYTGSFFITSYDINPSVGEKIQFSFTGRITSGVTRAIV